MGAGKTTIGRALAGSLGNRFVDMDEMIVEREKRPIRQIFSQEGEAWFRSLETKMLTEIAAMEPLVVSTGGGCIERTENREIFKQNGVTVFLDTPWGEIVERLSGETGRPLANNENDWSGTRQLYKQRLPLYRGADIIVQTGCRPIDVVVREISEQLT